MQKLADWRPALAWAFGLALAHRIILGIWLALVWLVIGVNTLHLPLDAQPHGADDLPALNTPIEHLALGVWRRWDARHYLGLAQHGYSAEDPGSTIFGILTPLGFYLLDVVVPGPVDAAALVFETLAFGLALTLLYRLCEVYYHDAGLLARQAVVLTALLPLSYFFDAPMSEAIYLAMVLGVFYAGTQGRWWLAAVFGALATLARFQGVVMAAVAVALLLERQPPSMTNRQRIVDTVKKGWPLVLIALSSVGLIAYRRSLNLPSLVETYQRYSYVFFANPLEGLLVNIRWFSTHLSESLLNADLLSMLVSFTLLILLFFSPRHRRLSLITYSAISICLLLSKLNWRYGTDEVIASISYGRYSLTLFPLVVLAADLLRAAPRWGRLLAVTVLLFGLLFYSAQHVLGFGPP